MFGNKRGAEATVLIYVLLALIVVGIIAYFTYTGFGVATPFINVASTDVGIVTTACEQKAKAGVGPYCQDFTPTKSSGLVSCQYKEVESALSKSGVTLPTNCPYKDGETAGKAECKRMIIAGTADSTTRVNGYLCSATITCTGSDATGLSGVPAPAGETNTCPATTPVKVTKGFIVVDKNTPVCCVPNSAI